MAIEPQQARMPSRTTLALCELIRQVTAEQYASLALGPSR